MPRDLSQWLHDTAVGPSEPVDPVSLILRARRRRWARRSAAAAGSLTAAALVGFVVLGLLSGPEETEVVIEPGPARPEPGPDQPEPGPDRPEPGPDRPEPGPNAGQSARFVPPSTVDGDRRILAVRFPGGTTAEIAYPADVDVHERGATPGGVLAIVDHHDEAARSYDRARVSRPMEVHRGEVEDVVRRLNDGEPPEVVAEYEGPGDETVPLFALATGDVLAWQADAWTVLLPDTMGDGPGLTDQDRALYAGHLLPSADPDGWLSVRADPPLRTEHEYVFLGDPQAAVAYARDPAPLPEADAGPDRVIVHASACTWGGRSEEPGVASWCDLDTQLSFDVAGASDFVMHLTEGLQALSADYPASVIDPAWVAEEEKRAWEADHGEGTWAVGYFYPAELDFAADYDGFAEALEPRWKRLGDEAANRDRQDELGEALVQLTGPPPPRLTHLWQGRQLELRDARLDGTEVVLDFAVLLAAGGGSTGGLAMRAQFDAVVFHHYPEAESVCVLLNGEPTFWLHDQLTCPSRGMP